MRRLLALVAVLVVLALPVVAAAQEERTDVGFAVPRVELVGDAAPTEVRFTVVGGSLTTVGLSLRDGAVDADGRGDVVDLGTTEDTLSGWVAVTPASFTRVGDTEAETFTATVGLLAGAVDRPRFGVLVAEVTEDGAVVASSAIPVVAVPGEAAAAALPEGRFAVEVGDLGARAEAFTIVDRLVPDLPGVIGHGPLAVSVVASNVGTSIVDARVAWEYHRLGVLDVFRDEAAPTLVDGSGPGLLIPGQVATLDASSRVTLESGPVDAMPIVGLVRVRATVTWDLAGVVAPRSAAVSRTVLVLPWSELLVGALAWWGWRRRFGRRTDLRYSNAPLPVAVGAHRGGGRLWRVAREVFDRIVGAGRGKRRRR